MIYFLNAAINLESKDLGVNLDTAVFFQILLGHVT